MTFPDYKSEEPLILTTDGSSCGAGGYLSQTQEGKERVIGYFSKIFTDSQSNLSATDKELEALREAIKFFRPYILDRKLILRVDHRPIVELSKAKHLNARLFRIYELLSTFDLIVEYLPGKQNYISDALSRAVEPSGEPPCLETLELPDDLVVSKISGGGDALVRAFAKVFLEDEERHKEVRLKAIGKIKRSPQLFNWVDKELRSKLLRKWELEGTPLPLEFASALALA